VLWYPLREEGDVPLCAEHGAAQGGPLPGTAEWTAGRCPIEETIIESITIPGSTGSYDTDTRGWMAQQVAKSLSIDTAAVDLTLEDSEASTNITMRITSPATWASNLIHKDLSTKYADNSSIKQILGLAYPLSENLNYTGGLQPSDPLPVGSGRCDQLESSFGHLEMSFLGMILINEYIPPQSTSYVPSDETLLFSRAACLDTYSSFALWAPVFKVFNDPKPLTIAELSATQGSATCTPLELSACQKTFAVQGGLDASLLYSTRSVPATSVPQDCDYWRAAWSTAVRAAPTAISPHCDAALPNADNVSSVSACGKDPGMSANATMTRLVYTFVATTQTPKLMIAHADNSSSIVCVRVDGAQMMRTIRNSDVDGAGLIPLSTAGTASLEVSVNPGARAIEIYTYSGAGAEAADSYSLKVSGDTQAVTNTC